MGSNLMLRFDQVWKTYTPELGAEKNTALKGVSFQLSRGETIGLVGANGAGKSTCIRLLMDFVRPSKGSVEVLGQAPRVGSTRRLIGYLPEVPSFPVNLTVLDLLTFVGQTCKMTKKDLSENSEFWLHKFGLWEVRNRPLRSYSKGMQQRANFVLALVADPELLILDEPMSGLDPFGREELIQIIIDLKSEGKTILFCSHLLEDVDRIADRLMVLHRGEKMFDGPLSDLKKSGSLIDGFVSLVGCSAK
jgi:ABC-2 type transport system ATP-binding protein